MSVSAAGWLRKCATAAEQAGDFEIDFHFRFGPPDLMGGPGGCQYRLPSRFAEGYEVIVQRPPMVGLRHVAIHVKDIAATEQFWVDVMGFHVEWRPDADNVYLTSGRDNLALHRASAGPSDVGSASQGGALDHIGLAVASASDVDGWASFLRARGVALHSEPRTHRDGSRSLYFRDVAGTLVQILWHVPIST